MSPLKLLSKKSHIFLLTTLIAIVLVVSSYIFYINSIEEIKKERRDDLEAISKLKINQIENWIFEREADAKVISLSPFFIKEVENWLNYRANIKLKNLIQEKLTLTQKEYGYESIFLSTTEGNILIAINSKLNELDKLTKDKINHAINENKITFTDFYFCETENKIHYDIIAPLINSKFETIAAIVFRVNPEKFLYPLIQSWPIVSKSSETLIIRKEQDSVLYLNELKHQKNTALKLKYPMTDTQLTAVRAVLGKRGIFEGNDYRNVKVLSYLSPIPNTPWFIVAKIDADEIFADVKTRAYLFVFFDLLLVSVCLIGLSWIYQTKQRNIYRKLWETQEEYKTTLQSIGDAVITTDNSGNIKFINPTAESLTEWKNSEAYGKKIENIFRIINEETRKKVENPVDRVLREGLVVGLANHTLLISKSGKEIPIADSGAPIKEDGNIIGVVLVFRDQTKERQAERLLKEAREFAENIIATVHESLIVLDSELRVISVNRSFYNNFKVSPEETIGKFIYEIGERQWDIPKLRELLETILPQNTSFSNFEVNHKLEHLGERTMRLNARRIYHEDNKTQMILLAIEDITERKLSENLLKESEEKFRKIWDKSHDGMRLTDKNGKILIVNDAYCRMVELQKENLENNFISVCYSEDEKDYIVESYINNFKEKTIQSEYEAEVTLHNGKKVWFEMSNSFIELKGETYLLGIFRDITERKRLWNELIEAKENAIEANRLKSGFISAMSHEIRTPLNVILGYTQLINDLFHVESDKELSVFFDAINRAGNRLMTTITQILDISRIEAGEFKTEFKPISLSHTVKNNFEQLNVLARNKHLQTELLLPSKDIIINGDEYCVSGVITNLLSNAIKFSNKGKIRVRVWNDDNFGYCSVKDEGVGMSDEYQKHLFETFSQEEVGMTRQFEGTGLGLALTKHYLQKMNGDIKIHSKKGVGTIATFSIPLSKEI